MKESEQGTRLQWYVCVCVCKDGTETPIGAPFKQISKPQFLGGGDESEIEYYSSPGVTV